MNDDLYDLSPEYQQRVTAGRISRRPACLRDRLNPLEAFDEIEFFSRFRVNKQGFMSIFDIAKHSLPAHTKKTNSPLSPIQQLSVTLRFLATGDFQISCGDFQGISQSSACRAVHRTTKALASLSKDVIVFPDNNTETNQYFLEYCGIPAISGIIDGSQIPIKSPGGPDAELYRCRKGFFSFNVQFVCDHKLKIMNVVSGWPGSTHDSRIWNNCQLKIEFATKAKQGLLLGDSGYPLEPFLMIPFPYPPNSRGKGRFNRALCKARSAIERCIGVLKRRWACLSRQLKCSNTRVPTIVVACSVLHNLCIDFKQPMIEDGQTDAEDIDEESQATVDPDTEYRPGDDFIFEGEEVRSMLAERFEPV